MSWVKLDDQFFVNRKAVAIGLQGRALFIASVCYCAMQRNDGLLTAKDLPVIAAMAGVPLDVGDALVAEGMWHPESTDCPKCRAVNQHMPVPRGGTAVHQYLRDNPSREQSNARREADAERQRELRTRKRHGVTRVASRSVSPSVPSRPLTNDPVLSSSGNSRGTSPPVDNCDDDEVPAEVWTEYAQLMLAKQLPGKIREPVPWKARTANNAQVELADDARRWWAKFEITPRRLAECLIDGTAPRNAKRRPAPATEGDQT